MLILSVQILLFICHLSDAKFIPLNGKPEKVLYDLDQVENIFKEFIETFGKKYEDETEYSNKLKIFTKNLYEVNRLNNASLNTVYGITHLHDMSAEEFHSKHTGCLGEINYDDAPVLPAVKFIRDDVVAPDSFDWRQQGLVSAVKNQGICSTCWAFSAIGAIEGQYAKKYTELQIFSEQQLIDCNGQNGGCSRGWWMHDAFMYAAAAGGVMSEGSYPYINGNQQCLFMPSIAKVTVRQGNPVAVESEEQLKNLLYQYGPLSIALDADSWHYYTGGVLHPIDNGKITLNHGVLLVGYGVEKGMPYWTIKNSWSSLWGDNGYLKFVRGQRAFGVTQYTAVVEIS